MSGALSPRSVYWLAAALVLAALPHWQRLPWPLTLLAATLALWRVYIARTGRGLPHRSVVILLVLGTTSGLYLHYGTLLGRDAGVALLTVMLMLKLLETRARRDAMLLVFLGYFVVITSFFYSQSIAMAIYALACVWVITAVMIRLHYTHPAANEVPQLRMAGVLLLQSVPLMLVLFVLFPRIHGPLWSMPPDARTASTGLSDTMTPGSLSNLTLSDAVAFRAVFRTHTPPAKNLYWRGPVLWDFDGRSWSAGSAAPQASASLEAPNQPVEYTVTVEPHGKRWLFAIDVVGNLPPGTAVTGDVQLLAPKPLTARMRYDVVSYLDYRYGLEESAAVLARARELPSGSNPRAVALGRELRRRHESERMVVNAVLRLFNEERFVYTLAPPLLGEHTVDEFLFRSRRGFCEHYSSAFVVLMRAAGIPARVVTGYHGGEVNPLGNYLIVRQADAHAWAEVWLRGEGWVRIDPTAAVSPERIERGIGAAAEADRVLPLFLRTDSALLRNLGLTWDSMANSWNQWVLGYSPERQRALLARAGFDDSARHALAGVLLAAMSIIVLVLAMVAMQRLRARLHDPVARAYLAYCGKLERKGLPRGSAEGPATYAARVVRERPHLAEQVERFTRLYIDLRYGTARDPRGVGRLQQLARDFAP
jgi:protein-glutamine gamma-glutamyltransferase